MPSRDISCSSTARIYHTAQPYIIGKAYIICKQAAPLCCAYILSGKRMPMIAMPFSITVLTA